MLHGIETVVYYVRDLKAAAAWYAKTFDLTTNYDTDYYVGFTVAGYELGLHPVEADSPPPGIGGQTVYWTVRDADAAMAHLLESGATALQPVQDVGGGIKIGSVIDPFGNAFGVIQNPRSPNAQR